MNSKEVSISDDRTQHETHTRNSPENINIYTVGGMTFIVETVFQNEYGETLGEVLARLMCYEAEKAESA